ncbi:MAG: DUF4114 domain-containing protein [Phycisphaeraceae bacterium]|nr:DUF4114 domain-containing protein [Phycisphaeraceae bacterium]
MRYLTMAVVAAAGVSGAALGANDYSFVHAAPGGELGHASILNLVYSGAANSGAFTSFGALSSTSQKNGSSLVTAQGYQSSALTFVRIQDRGGVSPLHLNGINWGVGQDKNWADGVVDVRVEAKYAGDSHVFGWHNDAGDGSFQAIAPTTPGTTVDQVSLSTAFRWGLKDTTTGKSYTSDETTNHGGLDQLVTYAMFDTASSKMLGWLLFWEDRHGSGADYDYNDAVVEVRLIAVPTPMAAGLGAAGMLAIGARRRRA